MWIPQMANGVLVTNKRSQYIIISLVIVLLRQRTISAELCDIVGGHGAVILDISESNGDQIDQMTSPSRLPVLGTPDDEVILSISHEGQQYFTLTGNILTLIAPLDREALDISSLRFQLSCAVLGSTQSRNIPVIVRVADINDNPPSFIDAPYKVTVQEDSLVGATVFNKVRAEDPDSGNNQQLDYHIIPGNGDSRTDGYGRFTIALPHQGFVTINSSLDYEATDVYYVTIQATDHGEAGRQQSATTTLTVMVQDNDDQDPKFVMDSCSFSSTSSAANGGVTLLSQPEYCPDPGESPAYWAMVTSKEVSGVLNVLPDRILAKDQDSLGSPITYSFHSGSPLSFLQYFHLDHRTASVSQIAAVDRSTNKIFNITIKAEEDSIRRGNSFARLQIFVSAVDTEPPRLHASSYSGQVMEAAPVGTLVAHDSDPSLPLTLSVSDPDLAPGEHIPEYTWELTTPAFKVTPKGHLAVVDSQLDRDPPNPHIYTFQVVVREARDGGAASSPLKLTVELMDINDNIPRLPVYPPVTLAAGEGRRKVIQVTGSDRDSGINAALRYSIISVSGGPRDMFILDRDSGNMEVLTEVLAGEQYSIIMKVEDGGGRSSNGVLDVIVERPPNTSGPKFTRSTLTIVVPEDAEPGYAVVTLKAMDPEGDTPRYSLSIGNELRYFDVDGLSGVITVVSPLDREELSSYNLIVKAEDDDGQFTTSNVHIIISDVNDQSPLFTNIPYSFRMDEGRQDASLGYVMAKDSDTGKAGEVSYALKEDHFFNIDASSGLIQTTLPLDYEKQEVHYLVVTASDGSDPYHEATATVTVLVNDLRDELPIFNVTTYNAKVKETATPGTVITTITSTDPDTQPQVTYFIVSGSEDLFSVHPDNGRVTVTGALDYEKTTSYKLIIATKENTGTGPGVDCRVEVEVEDVNDNAPVFVEVPAVTVSAGALVGQVITKTTATDMDGSKPNNLINYELTGNEYHTRYFKVDSADGTLTINENLENLASTEFQLKILARDAGDPELHTTVEVLVIVVPTATDHHELYSIGDQTSSRAVTLTSSSSRAPATFSQQHVQVDIPEDSAEGEMLITLLVLNKPPHHHKNLHCSILETPMQDMVEVSINSRGDCDVRVGPHKFDYEKSHTHSLTIALHSPSIPLPTPETKTEVIVNVLDVNDNAPVFIIDAAPLVTGTKVHPIIFATITRDASRGDVVIQIVADDADSGEGGRLKYSLEPGSNRGGYFIIDGTDGTISTARPLTAIPSQLLPFNLTLLATDDPNHPSVHHTTTASVIVNIMNDDSRLVLVLDGPPEAIMKQRNHITNVLQEQSSHLISIERIEERRLVVDEKIESDHLATDVYFHVVDQSTGRLLQQSHPSVVPLISIDGEERKPLLYYITSALGGVDAIEIRHPNLHPPELKESTNTGEVGLEITSLEVSHLALLSVGALIILLGITAIAFICLSYTRYKKKKRAIDKALMVMGPPLEHCESVIEPSTKEYEVQVLHMSVPMDDDSVQEVPMAPKHSHHISMDNVSYISKQLVGKESSSSDGGNSPGSSSPSVGGGVGGWGTSRSFVSSAQPGCNPAYERFTDHHHHLQHDDDGDGDGDDGDDDGPLSVSATNQNVMFGRRSHIDPSPVQTTTEL